MLIMLIIRNSLKLFFRRALDYLYRHLPRTFVNLVPMAGRTFVNLVPLAGRTFVNLVPLAGRSFVNLVPMAGRTYKPNSYGR